MLLWLSHSMANGLGVVCILNGWNWSAMQTLEQYISIFFIFCNLFSSMSQFKIKFFLFIFLNFNTKFEKKNNNSSVVNKVRTLWGNGFFFSTQRKQQRTLPYYKTISYHVMCLCIQICSHITYILLVQYSLFFCGSLGFLW